MRRYHRGLQMYCCHFGLGFSRIERIEAWIVQSKTLAETRMAPVIVPVHGGEWRNELALLGYDLPTRYYRLGTERDEVGKQEEVGLPTHRDATQPPVEPEQCGRVDRHHLECLHRRDAAFDRGTEEPIDEAILGDVLRGRPIGRHYETLCASPVLRYPAQQLGQIWTQRAVPQHRPQPEAQTVQNLLACDRLVVGVDARRCHLSQSRLRSATRVSIGDLTLSFGRGDTREQRGISGGQGRPARNLGCADHVVAFEQFMDSLQPEHLFFAGEPGLRSQPHYPEVG